MAVPFFKNLTYGVKMIKPILISIVPPAIIAFLWLLGSKDSVLFSEPVALILIGIIFISFANIGRKRFK